MFSLNADKCIQTVLRLFSLHADNCHQTLERFDTILLLLKLLFCLGKSHQMQENCKRKSKFRDNRHLNFFRASYALLILREGAFSWAEVHRKLTFYISYGNQSFDLLCESNSWFQYEMQHWAEIR